VIETHLSLLDGLSGELPEDPVLDGKVAFLTSPKAASRRNGPASNGLADTQPALIEAGSA
jgi:hypothetical protein